MELIPNSRDWWRLWSVRISAIGATAAAYWTAIPEAEQQKLLQALPVSPSGLVLAAFVANIAARVIRQPSLLSTNKGGGSGGDE